MTRRRHGLRRRSFSGMALVAALLLVGPPSSPSPIAPVVARAAAARPSLAQIEREVMCPVCGVPLDVAASPQAERERVFIRRLIAHGASERQIKHALVEQFGPTVLALPPHHGFSRTAYLVPGAVLIALLVGLAAALTRWRRRALAAPGSPAGASIGGGAGSPAPTSDESRRLDRELARFDR